MPSSNKTSKARAAIVRAVDRYTPHLKPGDTFVILSLPGHRQGHLFYHQEGLTAEQSEGVLAAVQAGILKSQKNPDPRLEQLHDRVRKHKAAEARVAGNINQTDHLLAQKALPICSESNCSSAL